MLNLLFISDSPKTEQIKSALQPELKVIIDVVSDFDHGLKDVFEKRPATVCIQDQIGGVTGESVARHIQMLLGGSAPKFILLHSGNGKARTINGLFEHLIDLSQANDTLSAEIKNTLKSLLGDHWDKIYIPPKLAPAAIRSSVAVPEESREDADKLVDDFISDLETSGFLAADEPPPALFTTDNIQAEVPAARIEETVPPPIPEQAAVPAAPDDVAESTEDVVEMLLAEAAKGKIEKPGEASAVATALPSVSGQSKPEFRIKSEPVVMPAVPPVPVSGASSAQEEPDKSPVSAPRKKRSKAPSQTETEPPVIPPPAVPAAAEFRISQDIEAADEHIPEDLLLAFEENYRSESPFLRRGVIVALVCVVCAAGVWFLFFKKPQLLADLKQRVLPAPAQKTSPAPIQPQASAPVPAPKQAAPAVPPPVAAPVLPSFVPKDGHDSAFASKNPGWERYVGKNAEFRLFSASGRIQALQILALKGAPLSDSYIKSVVQEFAGASGYQITSSSVKSGVRVESGKAQDKADVKLYRKGGAVKAFVVSLN